MSDSEVCRWGKIAELGPADAVRAVALYTQAMISACPVPDPKTARSRKVLLLQGEPQTPACQLPIPSPAVRT